MTVSLPPISVTEVLPKEIAATLEMPVTVLGSGFGTAGHIAVRIGELSLKLADGGRTDTVLRLTVDAVPEAVKQAVAAGPQAAQLVVERTGWAAGSTARITLGRQLGPTPHRV